MDLRVLQERMETIRAREASLDVLRILVLDASVPKQVLPLQFDGDNPGASSTRNATGENVGLGDAFECWDRRRRTGRFYRTEWRWW